MIRKARERILGLEEGLRKRISFSQGDVRVERTGKPHDAVVSLFHVMSYQTSDEDLAGSFATAKAHLKPGGIFLFDCWFGPAVLAEGPSVRVKRLEDGKVRITRIAEPVLYAEQNKVEVKYLVLIRDKVEGTVEEISEIHPMRYLFTPEVERLLADTGLTLLESQEWMTGRRPGLDTWNVCYIARA